ncbi:hypothetical protein Gogos_011552 [Gossypium gossypioides]|uniref:Plastid transcriptionally active 6 n=1 Tax=Gossypium gossypioides TaxID=34282 RepID=A0A7J9BPP0_GOSGO|nr:hypothetical protein [Gossypium gossypioides]
MATTTTATLFLSPPLFTAKYSSSSLRINHSLHPFPSLKPKPLHSPSTPTLKPSFLVRVDDGDADAGGPDEYDMDEDEVEELDNKKDFDVEYDPLAAASAATASSATIDVDIQITESKSFVSTQGWDSDMVVDYRINEEEFHKISLMDCDFFIRKPPDPDNDVYDFREMYVSPPDTDVYSIPKVLALMPQKYIRCAMSDYGCYNVTEPPIDAPRDPLYKTEREVMKV